MRALDWVVLLASLVSIVAYGLYRSRGSNTVDRYLLAGKTMPWYAMALSIMATQASAISRPRKMTPICCTSDQVTALMPPITV